jgi:hypothetical protein
MTRHQAPLTLRVECYAGYRGEQEPRRLWLGTRVVEVSETLDRWIGPDHRYFKVRGDDQATYILRHDEGTGLWELTLYDGCGRTPNPDTQ